MVFDSSILLVRGIIGVLAGVLAFLWPGLTIAVLVILFGFYSLIDGVMNLFLGVRKEPVTGDRSWFMVGQGIVGIVAGVLTFIWPGVTTLILLGLIGVWAVITGALEIFAAIKLRQQITGEWLLALSGALWIAFGLLLFVSPGLGAIGLAWGIAAYAVASGVVLIALGLRLRTHRVLRHA